MNAPETNSTTSDAIDEIAQIVVDAAEEALSADQ
jgi:hypothetical protein